jgi:hypothetical protein
MLWLVLVWRPVLARLQLLQDLVPLLALAGPAGELFAAASVLRVAVAACVYLRSAVLAMLLWAVCEVAVVCMPWLLACARTVTSCLCTHLKQHQSVQRWWLHMLLALAHALTHHSMVRPSSRISSYAQCSHAL